MRKSFLLAVAAAVLLGGPGSAVQAADPVSGRRDSLRYLVMAENNAPDTGTSKLTAAKANRAINISLAEICDAFDAYELLDTLERRSDSEGVALPSDCLRLRQVFRMVPSIEWRPAARIPMTPVEPDGPIWRILSSVADAIYEHGSLNGVYYYVAGRRLQFHPKYGAPDGIVDSVLVAYWAMAPGLTADSVEAAIDPELRDELVVYAASVVARWRRNYELEDRLLARYRESVERFGIRRPMRVEGVKQ